MIWPPRVSKKKGERTKLLCYVCTRTCVLLCVYLAALKVSLPSHERATHSLGFIEKFLEIQVRDIATSFKSQRD